MSSFLDLIQDVPDFPKPGIIFKDITPALADPGALSAMVEALAEPYLGQGITQVLGMEARGFIFAPAIAMKLGAGFVPVRKPGKLPRATLSASFALEYGEDTLEIHSDALRPSDKVLIVDDVMATGGTAAATAHLVAQLGATLAGFSFVIELGFLNGRKALGSFPIHSLLVL